MSNERNKVDEKGTDLDARTIENLMYRVYVMMLSTGTFLRLAQGRPVDDDFPHTAPSELTPETVADYLSKAHLMNEAAMDLLNRVVIGCGGSPDWWMRIATSKIPGQAEGQEDGGAK